MSTQQSTSCRFPACMCHVCGGMQHNVHKDFCHLRIACQKVQCSNSQHPLHSEAYVLQTVSWAASQIPYTRMQQLFWCHSMPHAKWVTHASMQQWTHCFTCRTQTDSLLQQFVIATAGVKQRLQHGMQAWLAAIQSVSFRQGSTHAAVIHGAPHLHGVGFCSVKECV